MLELGPTENRFRDQLLRAPLDIQGQVARTGRVAIPTAPGIGVEADPVFLRTYEIG